MSKRFGYRSLYELELRIYDKEKGKERHGKLNQAAQVISVEMGVIERRIDEDGYYEDARWLISVRK
jgi:hypothetical protein